MIDDNLIIEHHIDGIHIWYNVPFFFIDVFIVYDPMMISI